MSPVVTPERMFTVDEYFETEVGSELKHVFRQGVVRAMTGGSDNHIDICFNLAGLLRAFLKGKPCKGYGPDMRVEVVPSEIYTYPDLSIACPPIQKTQVRGTATLQNPIVVIEVLSPSTEAYDRGEKFNDYTRIPSLQEYLLISQHAAVVERRSRATDGKWLVNVVTGFNQAITIESIQCSLPLAEIYDKVELPLPPTE